MAGWDKRHRLLLRWSIATAIIAGVSLAFSIINRTPGEEAVLPGEQVEGLTSVLSRERPDEQTPIRFENVTDRSGIALRHFPVTRMSLLPEDMGSGVAVGDFDNDGLLDLFFVNFAANAIPDSPTGKVGLPTDLDAGRSRLYRNIDGQRFEDVTSSSGLDYVGLGMGAAWGDYDSDGDLDLYITAYGPNRLFENNGDGTFRDVTDQAGVQDTRFSAGASWADYDRDGHIDLYVCNYVDFIYRDADRNAVKKQYATEQPYTLNPSAYRPQPNALFRNRGDGTFENVAEAVGVDDPNGRSLAVSWVDYDSDGWVDMYVANDISNNGVFRNLGDGTFEDIGPQSLAADYRGAMGIAVADFDDDLDPDLFITHWIAQENSLFRNMTLDALVGQSKDGRIWFMDQADQYGLGQSSLDMVGWATGFCDFDNDGRRDLWLVNGSTLETTTDHSRLDAQPSFILWSHGEEGFFDVTPQASPDLANPFVGRGGALGDFDRDGLVDLVVVVHGGSPMILRNVSKPTGHWLRVRLTQAEGNTQALGARVYVTTANQTQMAQVGTGGTYLSQDELTLHFGLGDADSVSELRIVWPDGKEETHAAITVDRELTFTRATQ